MKGNSMTAGNWSIMILLLIIIVGLMGVYNHGQWSFIKDSAYQKPLQQNSVAEVELIYNANKVGNQIISTTVIPLVILTNNQQKIINACETPVVYGNRVIKVYVKNNQLEIIGMPWIGRTATNLKSVNDILACVVNHIKD